MPVIRTAVAALLASSLLLAACGDDDDDATTDTDTTEEATDETTEATEAETTETTEASPIDDAGDGGVEDGVLTVTMVDFAYEGLPESVPAGTRLAIENDSEAELHELIVFKLPDDEERSIEELIALPEEEADAVLGGGPPAAVLLAPPGGEQVDAVGDGTLAEPGRYAIFCAIPTGVDPEEYLNAPPTEEGPPEVPGADGPPHFTHGMFADLIVE
jgi:hypothetical protein